MDISMFKFVATLFVLCIDSFIRSFDRIACCTWCMRLIKCATYIDADGHRSFIGDSLGVLWINFNIYLYEAACGPNPIHVIHCLIVLSADAFDHKYALLCHGTVSGHLPNRAVKVIMRQQNNSLNAVQVSSDIDYVSYSFLTH